MQNTNNGIVLIGNGGHARAVRDVIESITSYSISLGGRPTIAMVVEDSRKLKPEDWGVLFREYKHYVIAIGQIKTAKPRMEVLKQIRRRSMLFPTIISPNAYVSPHAKIGQGTVIMHNAVVNAGAQVGDFCIVNTGAIVEHDSFVDDFCHISTGAIVNGGAAVGRESFVGSNAVVLNQIVIGDNVVLGAGSVACCTIANPGIYRGNPAGKIK